MLASMFVAGGINSLKNTQAMADRAKPVIDTFVPMVQSVVPGAPIPTDPKTLVRVSGAVQVLAGLALATGRAPRLSSVALAATLVPTTFAGHRFWEETDPGSKANQRLHFFKNVSVMGGLLVAGVDTEGKPGLAWRAKHGVSDVRREAKHLRKAARREARLVARSVSS